MGGNTTEDAGTSAGRGYIRVHPHNPLRKFLRLLKRGNSGRLCHVFPEGAWHSENGYRVYRYCYIYNGSTLYRLTAMDDVVAIELVWKPDENIQLTAIAALPQSLTASEFTSIVLHEVPRRCVGSDTRQHQRRNKPFFA